MTPTVEEVAIEIQSLLGDDAGRVFTTALAKKGVARAYRYLRDAMIKDQIPRAVKVSDFTITAGVTVFDPVAQSLPDFGELISIGERIPGSTDPFVDLVEGELGVMTQATALTYFEWREDKLHFYGATENREIRIRYYESGTPPATGSVGIENSFAFLSYYGAAEIAPSKGYDDAEIQRMRQKALGPHLDGRGGLLFDLLQPMVRSMSRVQRQPQPYSAGGWRRKRARPPLHIIAPDRTDVILSLPIAVSGTVDGVNTTFTLPYPVQALDLHNNGILQYPGVAYTLTGSIITFLAGYIPQSGDQLLAKGGSYSVPAVITPPTSGGAIIPIPITGTQDGVNPQFNLSLTPQTVRIFSNGILQYPDVAYSLSGNIVNFNPGYIPESIHLLFAEGIV